MKQLEPYYKLSTRPDNMLIWLPAATDKFLFKLLVHQDSDVTIADMPFWIFLTTRTEPTILMVLQGENIYLWTIC